VYCQYGRTVNLVSSSEEVSWWPDLNQILMELDSKLGELRKEKTRIDSITFSGYGEPTLYPDLRKAITGVASLRDEYFPEALVDMLTDSSTITDKTVFRALEELDSAYFKIDVGRQETFEAINRPAPGVLSLESIVDSIKELQDSTGRVILQSLFFQSISGGGKDNTDSEEIREIAEKALYINPNEMQIYSVSRYPSEPWVNPVHTVFLKSIAKKIIGLTRKKFVKIYV
jgi:wyosine [tRNA(Phe)-imidazoG37] synthetase (radical SAM superfamily)